MSEKKEYINTTSQKVTDLIDQIVTSAKNNYDFSDIVDLYSGLDRNLHLGNISNEIADAINSFIRFYNRQDEEENIPVEKRKPIKIYIDSCGGDVMGTLTIIDSIVNSKTPVWTINIGQAYSGGFFVFITGHKRIAYRNSSFLFHEGSTGTFGDANKFNNWADFYKKILIRLQAITIYYTNITEKQYKQHQKDDWWFFASEALKLKVCDEIADSFI